MVIYKETVFAIILVIGLLVASLIIMRRRLPKGNTDHQEEMEKPAGIGDSIESYLHKHHLGASTAS